MLEKIKLLFTWWNGRTIGLLWSIRRRGEYVGEDELGNKYYRAKSKLPQSIAEHRWVVFNGYAEGSAVPPGWHGWMSHKTDVAPSEEEYQPREWELPHEPNHTGTALAYRPPGSILSNSGQTKTANDYEPWRPA